jgi:hypothetical protein
MKLHYNKTQRNSLLQNRIKDLIPIADPIKTAQAKVVQYLQSKTEGLTQSKKKLSLLLFSGLFSGCSIAVVLYSFLNANTTVPTQRMTFPKYVLIHRTKPMIRDSLITYNEYARINQFRQDLKHLQEDAIGKKVYDSLLQARPYLLDSIHSIDSIFLTQ